MPARMIPISPFQQDLSNPAAASSTSRGIQQGLGHQQQQKQQPPPPSGMNPMHMQLPMEHGGSLGHGGYMQLSGLPQYQGYPQPMQIPPGYALVPAQPGLPSVPPVAPSLSDTFTCPSYTVTSLGCACRDVLLSKAGFTMSCLSAYLRVEGSCWVEIWPQTIV